MAALPGVQEKSAYVVCSAWSVFQQRAQSVLYGRNSLSSLHLTIADRSLFNDGTAIEIATARKF